MKTPVLIYKPSNHNAPFFNEYPYKQERTITSYARTTLFRRKLTTKQSRSLSIKIMMIVFLYFTMALDMDMFVVGQDDILRSSKYLDLHLFLNRTVSVLNCSCHKLNDAAASVCCQLKCFTLIKQRLQHHHRDHHCNHHHHFYICVGENRTAVRFRDWWGFCERQKSESVRKNRRHAARRGKF